MPAEPLPILVADFDEAHPADLLACPQCGFERRATEGEMGHCEFVAECPQCLPGDRVRWLEWKYQPGALCVNCGALEWSMPDGLRGCCSRRCMLQLEYGESLRAR